MKMTVRIGIRANNPHLHILSQNLWGEGEIFHGYRTYITMPTIDEEPISTILLDLGEKLS